MAGAFGGSVVAAAFAPYFVIFIPCCIAGIVVGACVGALTWEKIEEWIANFSFNRIINWLKNKITSFSNVCKQFFNSVMAKLQQMWSLLVGAMQAICGYIMNKLRELFELFVEAIESLYERILSVLNSIWGFIRPYATAGVGKLKIVAAKYSI